MRRFKWIDWNLNKVAAHGLTADEVEAAFATVNRITERRDGSKEAYAKTPAGRLIWIVWRYDREADTIPDIMTGLDDPLVFVITAYWRTKTMATPEPDLRSEERKRLDEQIASEPMLPKPDLPKDAVFAPMEEHLRRTERHPVAFTGIVENGVIRPIDPKVKLAEHSRVVIVTAMAG